MEWNCKQNKMVWLHEDICPTILVNEYRGNVIWEVEDEQTSDKADVGVSRQGR